MLGLIKNEVYKLLKLKKLYIFTAILLCFFVLQCITAHIIDISSENNPGSFTLNGQSFPIAEIPMFTTLMIIFIVIVISDMITSEYKNGTLKLSMLSPVYRYQLLLSKFIAFAISLSAITLIAMLLGYLAGTLFLGWGDNFTFSKFFSENGMSIKKVVSLTTAQGIWVTFKSYLISILPFLSFGSIIILVALSFTNTAAAIGTSLGIWFLFNIALNNKIIAPFIISKYFDVYLLFFTGTTTNDILTAFIVIFSYLVVFLASSILLLSKKDILM